LHHIAQVFYYKTPANSWLGKNGFKGQAIQYHAFTWAGELSDCRLDVSHDVGHPPEFVAVAWMTPAAWDEQLTPYVWGPKRPMYDALRGQVAELVARRGKL
jgi:hypothetical protein